MSENFTAQSLVQTKTSKDLRRFELTFVDAKGKKHTLSLPIGLAADLAPVLKSLAESVRGATAPSSPRSPSNGPSAQRDMSAWC